MDRRRLLKLTSIALGGAAAALPAAQATGPAGSTAPNAATGAGLWGAWDSVFARARFVSLSHVLTPDSPVWAGFPATTAFEQGTGRMDDKSPYAAFTYEKTGLETTAYRFATDQFGTQLDPPAHWHPCFAAIDELPPTLALRKLAVISIADKVAADANYHLSVDDILAWERVHGRIPPGCVVMVRSDWSKRWPDVARFRPADHKFPGITLQAIQLLHLERKILFHGHEPLDADSTPSLVVEDWLMNHGYMQAEGVAHLDQVPPTGALLAVGFPRLKGGTGGFASFTAICPSGWPHGQAPGDAAEAPLAYNEKRLVWNAAKGVRERTATCDKPNGKQSFN